MRELDHRVMRNPQTLASYRAWKAAGDRRAAPFSLAAAGLMIVAGLLSIISLAHMSSLGHKVAPILLGAGGVSTLVGLWRVARYRRDHPWVDPSAPGSSS